MTFRSAFVCRLLVFPIWLLALSAVAQGSQSAPAKAIAWRLIATYPHDPRAFTQGLIWHDELLYESTGLYGESSLRRVEPSSGKVLRRLRLPRRYFAEGLARVGQELYQLSWKAGVLFVHDLQSFRPKRQLSYRGEGWGLAHDGTGQLFMSDGSSSLQIRDATSFKLRRTLPVRDGARPVERLNELEIAPAHLLPPHLLPKSMGRGDAILLANVWQSDRIALIDLGSGEVLGWLDLASLLSAPLRAKADVLNGIAYEPERNALWVTGKWWPKMFVIELESAKSVDQ